MIIKALPTTETNPKSAFRRRMAMQEEFHPDDNPETVHHTRQLLYLMLEKDYDGFATYLSEHQEVLYFESKAKSRSKYETQKTIWGLADKSMNRWKIFETLIKTLPPDEREEWIFHRAVGKGRFTEVLFACSVSGNVDLPALIPDFEGAIRRKENVQQKSCIAELIKSYTSFNIGRGFLAEKTHATMRMLLNHGSDPNIMTKEGNAIHILLQQEPIWRSMALPNSNAGNQAIEIDLKDFRSMITILTSARIDINARTPGEQKSVFHLLDENYSNNRDDFTIGFYQGLVHHLLLNGAHPPEDWKSDLACVKEYRDLLRIAAETRDKVQHEQQNLNITSSKSTPKKIRKT